MHLLLLGGNTKFKLNTQSGIYIQLVFTDYTMFIK